MKNDVKSRKFHLITTSKKQSHHVIKLDNYHNQQDKKQHSSRYDDYKNLNHVVFKLERKGASKLDAGSDHEENHMVKKINASQHNEIKAKNISKLINLDENDFQVIRKLD